MNTVGIIVGGLIAVFLVWQVCLLVRDIKARKHKKIKKAEETSSVEATQTGVGSTQLEDHKKEN